VARRPIVTLTTDFGTQDHFIGTMKGVILENVPEVQFVDISHSVQAFDVFDGALTIAQAYSYFVFGEVKKPGAYTLDKDTNILEGITVAGGFTDKAAPGRTRVIRATPQGQKVIEVDMNDILRRGREAKAVMLQESDVVVVPESFF